MVAAGSSHGGAACPYRVPLVKKRVTLSRLLPYMVIYHPIIHIYGSVFIPLVKKGDQGSACKASWMVV